MRVAGAVAAVSGVMLLAGLVAGAAAAGPVATPVTSCRGNCHAAGLGQLAALAVGPCLSR